MKVYLIEVQEGVYDSFLTFQWIGTDKEEALRIANNIKPGPYEIASITVWEDGKELVGYTRNEKDKHWRKPGYLENDESIEELERNIPCTDHKPSCPITANAEHHSTCPSSDTADPHHDAK